MTDSQTPCLRVLHCIPNMGGGGAERQLTHLSRALIDKGVDVHVALCEGGANMARLKASGAEVHMVASRHHYDVFILFRLIGLIRRLRPHVVQTWMCQMDVLAGIAALVTGTALMMSERTSATGHPRNWKSLVRTWIAGRGATVIANSQAGLGYWENRRQPVRIKVIGNIIAFDEIDRAAAGDIEGEVGDTGPLIVAAGRLFGPKNTETLVEALTMAAATVKQSQALVFGEGPLRESLERMCRARQVEARVKFMGFVDPLYGWFKRADVFVSASFYEGSPNTVLEAIACRLPVVVSDIPAHRELLDESSAFFVCPHSAESIADGIVQALADKEARETKAQRAYARLIGRRSDAIAEEYVAAYKDVLGERY